ncbi:MAG: GNAT family N-acetyltransferase [Patescibacteria group bacterium]
MNYSKEIKKDCYAVRMTARENDEELGHAYLYIIFNDLHKEPYGLLEDVFVSDKCRGRGVGSELLKMIINEAKERGCYKLIADSRNSRTEVHAWYLASGFVEYGKEFRMEF